MDKINEQMYKANIELVDKNRLLEEDKKILIKRINRAIEYLEPIELISIKGKMKQDLLNILKGRYVDNE